MPSQRLKGFKVFKRLEGFKGFKGLEGLEGFKRLRAGKRQTWTPIRSHRCVALGCCKSGQKKPLMCGLGVAVGCRMKHAKSAFDGFLSF